MQGLEKLPPALREPVRAQWDDWRAAAAAAGVTLPEAPELAESLPRVWAASDWLVRQCLARPALLAEIWATDPVRPDPPGAMRERVTAAVAGASDDKAFMAALRRARNLEQARIAWRDLAGWASLDETLGDLSAFADLAIETALEHARASLEPRFGVPRDADGERVDLVVLGMGKLGGQELNFSSDIDLIFSYRAGGQTDGERTLSNEEYFTRLGQRLIRLLDEPTAEGFVFRVDMRLRPFGEAGPLVLNFGAMETYYQTHGREWERYAFIKARPCAGDRAAGEELLAGLRPFIYRRYLDFAVFESLREMKDMISAEVVRRGLEDNVKLGRGGIREIEFIGQLFQLIRAGREPALRERRIMLVLPALAEAGYLAAAEVERLLAAYRFLRRLENRLQAWGDRQTHDLPHAPALRERLALAMEFDGWPALAEALEAHRRFVQQMFDQVFVGPRLGVGEHRPDSRLDAVWERTLDEAEARRVLTEEGYEDGG
ncbi:MAG: bifunctional [glutamate--ammonia ligase]-adenylyl-L-tyrosine phosphorylase/[glutamate--ammonia-ligase] adenylyltransferase, partial [Gammaproteobacteria bacterium]